MSETCKHPDTWFSRTVCPEPCGYMHTYCTECSEPLDPCANRATPEIRSEDLQIGAYELRQSMDYVVVVHHVPSGLTVASASEKSQLQNKAKALRELHALLDAAPGPAPDQAAAEAAERELRAFAGTDPFRPLEVAAKVVLAELDRQREWIIELQRSEDELLHHKLWALREVSRLLAELDRQRARIAAVLEAVERRAGEFIGIRYEPVMTCSEIRALLEGEER